MTDILDLKEKVNKFNKKASQHLEAQSLNPFSDSFGSRSPSPRPKFSKEDYGKPVAGSLTEARGQRAYSHISREILDLCTVIHDVGKRQRKKVEGEDEEDNPIIISFGELFRIYTKISDKVVGLLIAAKKRGFVYFEGEILFQRRDDDVLIGLIKPIEVVRSIVMRQSVSPCPFSAGGSGNSSDQDH